jgi:DNA modification methylase
MHPTQKPIALVEWFLEKHAGEIVADTYVGSGTTIIACERLGRKCRAIEISPAYCAVAIQRWVDVTGGTPELVN